LINENKEKEFASEINGRQYILFAVNNSTDGLLYLFTKPVTPIIVSAYEMIRLFAVFLIFILLPIIVISLPQLFKLKFKLTFRTAIFIGLVTVSIIPLILLALYFRNLSEEKNLSSTLFKLNKKALEVGKYLEASDSEIYDNPLELFEMASRELRYDFSVFHKDKIYFTTHPLYFENGIIPDVLNPEAIVNIELEQINDILVSENIEQYARHVFYKKFSFRGDNYIIQIDEAFNPILLPISEKDLDIMLITSYSVTALGIILFGLLLAYYLSRPINKLTEATREIALGNLDLQVNTKAFGEVKELVNGFNYMSEQLKVTQKKLLDIERESAWREMARQVAHEIKNPLTPMKLSLQQLIALKKESDPNFETAFNKITTSLLSQIESLKNIASEFSSLGKLPEVKLQNIELFDLLRNVSDLFSNKQIKILLDSSLKDVFVKSDEEYLSRIFVNLFRNAEEAGATEIKVKAVEESDKVIIFVGNNGRPISPEMKDKIFEKNFTTKKKGSGLGLFITARFLEETNGEIKLEKSDEKETVFKIILYKNE
jgi:two-component system nitrogen regulation sensor histidine kinase NtrY